jgi:hypothetical protein
LRQRSVAATTNEVVTSSVFLILVIGSRLLLMAEGYGLGVEPM